MTVLYLIDKEAPTGDISKNEEWTNEAVRIRISDVEDTGGSLFHSMTLPNGETLQETEATYIVTRNGEYRFTLRDNADNERELLVKVTNLDRRKPVIKTLLKQRSSLEVTVTIQINDLGDSK